MKVDLEELAQLINKKWPGRFKAHFWDKCNLGISELPLHWPKFTWYYLPEAECPEAAFWFWDRLEEMDTQPKVYKMSTQWACSLQIETKHERILGMTRAEALAGALLEALKEK